MTTRYKLPDQIGGGEVDAVEYEKDGQRWVWFPIGDWMMHCRAEALTEVKPPLPPEPPNGTILSNGIDAFIRCDDENDPGVGAWYCTGDKQIWAWAEVAPTINPGYRRRVPDPAANAPELPYHLGDERASVYRPRFIDDEDAKVYACVKGDYTASECRQIGAAFLRAAREAEQP